MKYAKYAKSSFFPSPNIFIIFLLPSSSHKLKCHEVKSQMSSLADLFQDHVFRNITRKERSSCSFYGTILWQRLIVNTIYGDSIMKFDFVFNRNDHLRSFLDNRKNRHRSKECYINQIHLQAISRDSCHLLAR